ncbi:MAG TPA: hypothetical protein PLJ38_00415, partial [bacterium]|nr:hypothetical protein [bacterium]
GIYSGSIVYVYENEQKIGYFNIIQVEEKQSLAKVNPLVFDKIRLGAKLKTIKNHSLFDAGNFHFKKEKYEDAIKYYSLYLEKNPKHYPTIYNIGLCYFKQKNYARAGLNFDNALQLNPFNLTILKAAAITDFILAKENEFIEKAKRIISIDFSDEQTKILLAIILSKYKEYTLANQTMNLPSIEMDILKSINLIHLKNYSDAIAILNKLETDKNEFFEVNKTGLIACAYMLSDKKDKAQEPYDKFIRFNPELKSKEPIDIVNFIDNNVKGYISQQIILKTNEREALPIEISKIASLLAAQELRKREIETMRREAEIQAKSYSKSKFNSTTVFERKDKKSSTAQTNPVPGANFDFNLAYQNKIGDYTVQSSVKYFRNRWDGVTFDEFKASISHNNFRLNIGKFSTKNFGELVKHPSVEFGIGGEFLLDNILKQSQQEADIYKLSRSMSKEFYNSLEESKIFKNNIITFAAGITKEALNKNQPKEKNENNYESGQYLQYAFALNYRTSILNKLELGLSSVYIEEDDNSAEVDTTSTKAKRNTAFGFDGNYQILKNLKLSFEHGWTYYDDDINDSENSISDKSYQADLNYKLNISDWKFMLPNFFYNYADKWLKENDIDANIKVKTITGNWYLEGGDQGSDGGKRTWTYTLRHSRKSEKLFRINGLDYKYEYWKNNLDGSTSSKTGSTAKITTKTLLPLKVNYEFSYQLDLEWCALNCSDKTEKIYDHILNFNVQPISTKFTLNFNRDYKYDESTNAPNDEKKNFFAVALDNSLIKQVPIKLSWQLEHKNYYNAAPYSYRDMLMACELSNKYKNFINGIKYEYGIKKFSNTDRNDPASAANQDKFVDKISYSVSYKHNADLSVFAKYQYTDENYKPYSTSRYIENNYRVEVKYNF